LLVDLLRHSLFALLPTWSLALLLLCELWLLFLLLPGCSGTLLGLDMLLLLVTVR
jgi:hypothetical protein